MFILKNREVFNAEQITMYVWSL